MTTNLTNAQQILPDLKLPEVAKLEKTVREGLNSFIEVGKAIVELRDRNAWKVRGYKTPDEYFQATFGFGERQALRLADGFQTAEKVKEATGELPRNEFAARVIKPIASDAKLLNKVQDQLKKKGLSIATATADKIQEIVERVTPKTQPMFEDAKESKARECAKAVAGAGLSDKCPKCEKTPERYEHKSDNWFCGSCGAVVRVSAILFEIVVCNDCGAPLLDESGICRKCGCVQ